MIRVLSYNLRALRDDADAAARVIRACEPDLVCLQEVPRFGGWKKQRDALAAACDLTVLSSRRSAGLAVLGAPGVRLLRADYAFLSWSPPLHRRALAVARVKVAGVDLTVASTHLDLVPGARLRHVKEILRLLAPSPVPVVLAGDFNEEPGGDAWNLLSTVYQDAYAVAPEGEEKTFTAYRPRVRIDGVFVDKRLRVTGCGVPGGMAEDVVLATDHRPLLARLTIA